MRRHTGLLLLLCAAVVTAAACDRAPLQPRVVQTIDIEVAAEEFIIGSGVTVFVDVGKGLALRAMGNLSDGDRVDISSIATWTSDDDAIVTVATGAVVGRAVGTTTIRAKLNGVEGRAKIGVNP